MQVINPGRHLGGNCSVRLLASAYGPSSGCPKLFHTILWTRIAGSHPHIATNKKATHEVAFVCGGDCWNRTRVRKTSAFRSTCLFHLLVWRQATRWTGKTNRDLDKILVHQRQARFRLCLWESTPGTNRISTALVGRHLQVIKLLVRSCYRLQLKFVSLFYERTNILGMHLKFCTPRRSQVVPLKCSSQLYSYLNERVPANCI